MVPSVLKSIQIESRVVYCILASSHTVQRNEVSKRNGRTHRIISYCVDWDAGPR